MSASRAWRILVVAAVLMAAVALALAPFLYSRANEGIEKNRETNCAIGAFLTGAPIVRIGEISHRAFLSQLVATRAFLVRLRSLDCPHTAAGASITVEAIERQLARIADAIEAERRAIRRDRAHRRAQQLAEDEAAAAAGGSPPTASGSSPPGSGDVAGPPAPGPAGPAGPPGSPGGDAGSTTTTTTTTSPGGTTTTTVREPGALDQIGGGLQEVLDGAGHAVDEIRCSALPDLCPPKRRH